MPVTKTCLQCGRTFISRSKAQKFCSLECYWASKRILIEKTCPQCGRAFQVKPSRRDRKFCSRECWAKGQQQGSTKIVKTCPQCGRTFHIQPSWGKQKFCSRECYLASKQISKTCPQCGRTFQVPHSRKAQKFCSRECREASLQTSLKKTCPQCGRTFASTQKEQKFCSRECYWASMRTPVTREELDYWYNELEETTEQIGRRLGINGRTVRDIMEKFGLTRRGKAEAAIDYPRRPFSGDAVEEAYLRGFRVGDLNVRMDLPTSQTIHVRCGTTRAAQVDLIRSLFEPYGHVHTRLGTHGETQVECHLDLSFRFLLEKEDRAPDWVMRDDDCFWAFLAGYMDAEGYIGINRQCGRSQARVEIASCDVGILRGLWAGLNARGVRCPQLYLKKRAGTVDRQGRRSNCDFYCLSIQRKVSLDRLFRGVDPYLKHADKRTAITRAWANIRERGLP